MLSNSEFKEAIAMLNRQMQQYEQEDWDVTAILGEIMRSQTLQDVMNSKTR